MVRIRLPLILYKFVWLIQSTYSLNRPLIFNPYTLQIYDYGDTSMTYKSGPYAAACPATSKHETKFNEQFSLNDKSLFVRHYSNFKDDKIYRIQCKSSIELAAAYYTDPSTNYKYLKFGYEVYFAESRHPETFNKSASYSSFERALKSVRKRISHFMFGSPQIPLLSEDDNPVMLKMGFIWISKATFQFTKPEWRVSSLAYSIHKRVDWPATECDDYRLHDELYPKGPLDDFYSVPNQKKTFTSVQLHEGDCESNTFCMQKYTLIPAYQLQISVSKPASCTNMATVPIWSKTTAPLLDYLDKFLFAVAQLADRKLTIYPEVFDTLALPTIDGAEPKSKDIYLYSGREKLAIPKIIIKLVAYQTHSCDISKMLCWFQVVIIIHNEPTVTQKLCEKDICQQLGWESIQYLDKDNPKQKSEHIYCCEMSKSLQEIIMGSMEKTIIRRGLDLKKFPQYDKTTDKFSYEDKKKLIEDKVNRWIDGEEYADAENSWPSLPPPEDIKYLIL